MKHHRLISKGASTGWLACVATCTLSLTSCDKVGDWLEQAKGLVSDEEQADAGSQGGTGVESVDEKAGKAVIAEESRMVMVEFYSDT
ncbi:MAG: hypothetical protein H7A51_07405 [Akkermansiaceae bacterium]|nr:hypothetical protein [Akkermansiaceae bacterium]